MALTAVTRQRIPYLPGAPQLVVYTGTDPAANTEVLETVPAGKVWVLQTLTFTFVADANVATRRMVLIIDTGGGGSNVYRIEASGSQAAGTSVNYTGDATQSRRGELDGNTEVYGLTSQPLGAGMRIRTTTTNIQVGDNYGVPVFSVLEYDV